MTRFALGAISLSRIVETACAMSAPVAAHRMRLDAGEAELRMVLLVDHDHCGAAFRAGIRSRARALAALTNHRLVPMETGEAPDEMVSDLVAITSSAANLTSELADALKDGSISINEARRVEAVKAALDAATTILSRKLAAVKAKGEG